MATAGTLDSLQDPWSFPPGQQVTRPEVHLERELSHDVEPGSQLFPTPLAVVYWKTLPKELSQGQVQGQIPENLQDRTFAHCKIDVTP